MIRSVFAGLMLASALGASSGAANSAPAATATAAATASASPSGADGGNLHVRGQALSYREGFFVFTTGDAIRLRTGTILPKGLSIGSVVRVTVDETVRDVISIELDPHDRVPNEIDVAAIPRRFVVISEKSAPLPTPGGEARGLAAAASGLITVTIDVRVPANTPPTDDVYLSTDRSNYSPAEVRMQRVDARRFTISLGLATNTIVKYTFTRGTFQSVERDRSGGVVPPHQLPIQPNAKADDTVARWADIS